MNPQDMDKMAAQVEGLFFDLQNRLTGDIVRRIQKMDKITQTADLQINTLLNLGNTSEYIEKELMRTTGYSYAKIWELYDKVVEDQYTQNKAVYEQVNDKFIPFNENEELQGWYNSAVSRNQDEILNITQSLGFYVSSGYGRKVFTPLSQIYSGYLNNAAMDVITGSQSYNTVLRRVSKELSSSGLQWVDYSTGYHCRATTAARRAVLTGVNQMSAQINEQTAKDLGADTFEVTWHSGARPEHWWGGNIYTKKQLGSICGLGNVDGLCGANCRHSYHAFIPGISVRTYSEEELNRLNAKEKELHAWNGKQYNAYEATAKQREMERTMRAQRSNICSLKSGGADQEDIIAAQSRYLNTLHSYNGFSKAMGIQPDMERVYVDRLGRVINGNVFGFNNRVKQKELAKGAGSGKIKKKKKLKKFKGDNTIANAIGTLAKPMCNPNFAKSVEYRTNCGYCSATYELRRRGFDVIANPRAEMSISDWKQLFNGTEIKRFVVDYSGSVKKSITNQIKEAYENGARGSIYVQWKNTTPPSAHYFSWEIEDGKVRFVDAQTGRTDASVYFKDVVPRSIRYVRWDDKTPSKMVENACKNRGGIR